MPCVTPLMVGTRRRRLSHCQPGSEEPARSWDERHLPSQGPFGLGEHNAMVVLSEWRVPRVDLHSLCPHGEAAALAMLPCPKSSSPSPGGKAWARGWGWSMGCQQST